jgi:hypothetical protein
VKLFPAAPSSLLLSTLALAIRAREVDMRASPYDLHAYRPPLNSNSVGLGFNPDPIRIETPQVGV